MKTINQKNRYGLSKDMINDRIARRLITHIGIRAFYSLPENDRRIKNPMLCPICNQPRKLTFQKGKEINIYKYTCESCGKTETITEQN